MFKKILLVLALLVYLSSAATIIFTGAQNSLFSDSRNWNTSTVPGNGDIADLGSSTVTLTGTGASISGLIISGGNLVLTGASGTNTLSVQNNFNITGAATIQVCPDCRIQVTSGYMFFSTGATVTFENSGVVQASPFFMGSPTLKNTGNTNVIFPVTPDMTVQSSVTIPTGFTVADGARNIRANGGSATLTFDSHVTTSAWNVENNNGQVNLAFNQGADINGDLGVIPGANTGRPSITLNGRFNILGSGRTIDLFPTFSSSDIVEFFGNSLQFNNKNVTLSTPILGGTTAITFSTSSNLDRITLTRRVDLTNPSVDFSNGYTFVGNSLFFNYRSYSCKQRNPQRNRNL